MKKKSIDGEKINKQKWQRKHFVMTKLCGDKKIKMNKKPGIVSTSKLKL